MGSPRAFVPPGCRLGMLVLAMLFVESVADDLLFDPEWGFDSFEITIPQKLSFRRAEQGVASPLSYLLRLESKKLVLHLWPKKSLWPRNLPVFSFTEQGELLEDHPHIPSDCSYRGWVEGALDSEATLSTCTGGLRGILNIDARYYQIEPLVDSPSFEHVIYLLKREPLSNQTCGVADEETGGRTAHEEEMPRFSDLHPFYVHKKYMELVMIFDYNRFLFVKFNISRMIDDAVLLTAIMDTYFQEINLRVFLKSLEFWTSHDRIFLGYSTLAEVLGQFVLYRQISLNLRLPSDWAHLYVTRKYTDALAWSWGRTCDLFLAGSASSFLDANVLGPATWSAHELGHSLGMAHDGEYCQCRGRKSCIMGTGRRGFSNCSYGDYFTYASRAGWCLNNIPGPGYVIKRCGNKIVEEDEECDCGSKEDCRKDKCCGPDCKLKQGVNCSFGLCCHQCDFLPSGYVCRQEENECDLAEYCNGTSGLCPEDTYKQDGTPCKYEGLCFSKGCRSRYMQCQSIFGPDAKEAPHRCYDEVNLKGDQYGNCEINDVSTYRKCAPENAICGRLQCINVKTLPDLPDHSVVIATYLKTENIMCWGTGYHLAMQPQGIPDMGVIYDGTYCGPNRVCVNRTCVNISTLQFDCLPEKCNHRGICNHKKNCHCMYGWAPPLCEEVGFGGSIDSGPPALITQEVPSSFQVVFLMLLRFILFAISVVVVLLRQLIMKCLNPAQTKNTDGVKNDQK